MSKNCIARLSKLIQFKTVSDWNEMENCGYLVEPGETKQLLNFLRSSYPNIFQSERVTVETINDFSVLITIKGENSQLAPILCIAHTDVVPANSNEWKCGNPFDGSIIDDILYGRGAIDDKGCVLGLLEAVEAILSKDSICKRTLYIALTHDEEVGGKKGAVFVSKHLEKVLNGKKLEFILDEGGILACDVLPGIKKSALIGISEKTYMDVAITANTEAGHASMPVSDTALSRVVQASLALRNYKFRAYFKNSIFGRLMNFTRPYLPFFLSMFISFSWYVWDWPIRFILSRGPPSIQAQIKTTHAQTIMHAGTKSNVIPSSASLTMNIRVHHNDTVDNVLSQIRSVISPFKCHLKVITSDNISPISSTSSMGYKLLSKTIEAHFPEFTALAYYCVGCTDSRHFAHLAKDIYRFLPFILHKNNISCIHGADEHVSVENVFKAVAFYEDFLNQACF